MAGFALDVGAMRCCTYICISGLALCGAGFAAECQAVLLPASPQLCGPCITSISQTSNLAICINLPRLRLFVLVWVCMSCAV